MATRYGGVLYLRSEREREREREETGEREKRKLCFKFRVHRSSFRDRPTTGISAVRRCLLSLPSFSLAKTMMGSAPPGNRKQKRKRRIDENYYHKVASRMAAFWLREDRSSRSRVSHLAGISSGATSFLRIRVTRGWDLDGIPARSLARHRRGRTIKYASISSGASAHEDRICLRNGSARTGSATAFGIRNCAGDTIVHAYHFLINDSLH